MCKGKKKPLSGLIFGVGLIALLIGPLTDVYATTTGVIIALSVWIIGGALVKLVCGEEKKQSPPPPPPPQA